MTLAEMHDRNVELNSLCDTLMVERNRLRTAARLALKMLEDLAFSVNSPARENNVQAVQAVLSRALEGL